MSGRRGNYKARNLGPLNKVLEHFIKFDIKGFHVDDLLESR